MTIRNPIEWSGSQFVQAAHALKVAGDSLHHMQDTVHSPMPVVRRIHAGDIWDALKKGFQDFEAYRTDVLFLGIVYAGIGLVLARVVFRLDLLPLLFPLASGFAIVGPFAAIGLYEMSRLREMGAEANWTNAFDVFKAPAIGSIAVLGAFLIATFLLWLATAWGIYLHTFGASPIVSIPQFAHDVLHTPGGQAMIYFGIGAGFLFALFALTISIVSFPLLIDRDVGFDTAIATSFRAVVRNPWPMALWGFTVAALLVLGSLPAFVGLIVVLPMLGHATWHLYRKIVPRDDEVRRLRPAFDDIN